MILGDFLMKNALAALALTGSIAFAPAAMAADPDPVPVVAEAAFVAPEAEAVSSAELAARHDVADVAEQAQTAGGMDQSTGLALGGLLGIVIALALLSSL